MVEAKRTNIRRVRTSDGTRRETDYLVTYAFEAVSPDGHETTERVIEHEVPRSIYNTLRSGQEVEIRYLPEDPRRGDFYPGEQQGTARVLGWAMAILLGSAVTSLMVAGVLSRRGERSSPARGRIQSV
jgi:hypothetical protein